MRFLVDNSVSWRVGRDLRDAGHDVVHVADVGLEQADDAVIYGKAVAELRLILTQDSDFGAIHASESPRIGVILIRLSDGRPSIQATVLLQNLSVISEFTAAGNFVIIEDDRITVRGAEASSSD